MSVFRELSRMFSRINEEHPFFVRLPDHPEEDDELVEASGDHQDS